MEDNQKKSNQKGGNQKEGVLKKSILKVVVPIVILIGIGGIWLAKNPQELPIKGNKAVALERTLEQTIADVPARPEPDFELHVTEELDLEKLKSYGLPIMIDFGADSCIPCKEMAPVLEKLNEQLQGKVIIKFVDVWKYQGLAQGYPMRVIPTQVFIDKDGKPYVPSNPEASNMNMYSSKETNEHVFTTHEGGMTEEMILAVLKEMGLEE